MTDKKAFSSETIERMRAAGRAQFATPEARKAHGDLTRERLRAAAPQRADLARLRDAWRLCSPATRARFLAELVGVRDD